MRGIDGTTDDRTPSSSDLGRWVAHALLVLTVSFTLASSSIASEIPSLTLESMAKGASLIFAGTVREVKSRTNHGRMVTDVRFEDLKIVVGHNSGQSLTLTLAGVTCSPC